MSRYDHMQSDSSVFSTGPAAAHFLDFNIGYNFTAMWDVDFSQVVEDLNCLLSEDDVDQCILRLLLPIKQVGVAQAVAQHQKRLNSSGHQFGVLHAALNYWKVKTGGACHGLDVFEALDDYRPGLAMQCREALGLEVTSSQNLKYLTQSTSPAGLGGSSGSALSQRNDWTAASPHHQPPPPRHTASAAGVTGGGGGVGTAARPRHASSSSSFPASSGGVLQCLEAACQRIAGLEQACGRDDTSWLQYRCLWDASDVGHQQLAAVLRHLAISSQSLLHRMEANRDLQVARELERQRAAALDAQSRQQQEAAHQRHHRQLHHGDGEQPPPYTPAHGQSMTHSFHGMTSSSPSTMLGAMSYASVTAAASHGRQLPTPRPEQGQAFAATPGQWQHHQQQGMDNAAYVSEVLPRMAGVSLSDAICHPPATSGQNLHGPVLVRDQAVVPANVDNANQRRKEAVRGHGVDFVLMNAVQVKHVGQQLECILSRQEQLKLTAILMHQLGTSANGAEEIESLRNSSDACYRNLSFVVALITRWKSMVADTLATGKTVYEALQEISDQVAHDCSAVLKYPQQSSSPPAAV